MNIIIDNHAGPCPGVKRAIALVEEALAAKKNLTAIGPLIHNKDEVTRLANHGLKTAEQENIENGDFSEISQGTVFIRSHGISQKLHNQIIACNADVIDGTCGIVHSIQKQIADKFADGFQIVIVGKPDHAEVKGLNGYCEDQAIIVQNEADIAKIDPSRKTFLVSQTTIAQQKFLKLAEQIAAVVPDLLSKDTTCRQVSKRHENIRNFANEVDVLLLVGGKHSSNTAVLFEIAAKANPHSHWVESIADVELDWLTADCTVGITGSASTPIWQLEKLANELQAKVNFI